jgi:hypothetical protein
MKSISADQAQQYVRSLALPARPGEGYEAAAEEFKFDFDAVKNQAMIVGSDIVSFVKGVTPERREDIVNCSLLAQLAAKQKVGDMTKIYDWYNAYFDVLTNIGWAVQARDFATYTEASENFDAHEAIIKVAESLLGPTATAMVVIKATLDALKSMSSDSPWITLFNRESLSANTAKFQVTLAEQGVDDQFIVTLMAFGLEAKAKLTQVLFFKYRTSEDTLKHYSGKVTINSHVLSSVREMIKKMITDYTVFYLKALKI